MLSFLRIAAPTAGTTKKGGEDGEKEPGQIVEHCVEKAEQYMQDYLEVIQKYAIPLAKHGDTRLSVWCSVELEVLFDA
jgi:hypothetical protein